MLLAVAYLAVTAACTTAVVRAGVRRSWRLGGAAVTGTLGVGAVFWYAVAAQSAFRGAYLPLVAGGYLATALVPGALGAPLVLPPPAPRSQHVVAVGVAGLLWLGLAVATLLVSACSLDVDCY
jgi:hypothetical protein